MKRQLHIASLAAILLALASGTAPAQPAPPQTPPARAEAGAADTPRPRQQRLRQRVRQHELIYGAQIMTPQEREEYRVRLRAARKEEERQRLRAEHRERMTARAKEQGVTLPEDRPAGGAAPAGARP